MWHCCGVSSSTVQNKIVSDMTFIYVIGIFSHIFDHYPPHVCIRLHFKDPSLKRMSANREFNPPHYRKNVYIIRHMWLFSETWPHFNVRVIIRIWIKVQICLATVWITPRGHRAVIHEYNSEASNCFALINSYQWELRLVVSLKYYSPTISDFYFKSIVCSSTCLLDQSFG